jgi:superfamily II DNA helicase RecQ
VVRPVAEVSPIPKRAGRAPTVDDADLTEEQAALDAALRAWRLERSRQDKVAPFIVASNALVRAIAVRKPATAKELLGVHGMGPTKLDLYGDEILAVLDGVSP